MVRRLLGLERLPDVATVSRTLAGLDDTSVTHLRRLSRQRALDQLGGLGLARITLDFDGSVLSTGRFAEGTAVGFNRKKKGQRVTIPCFAPSPRPDRSSMSGIVPVTCMIPMVPRPSSWPACGKSRRFCLAASSRRAWTALFSAMTSSGCWTPKGFSSPSACPLNALPPSRRYRESKTLAPAHRTMPLLRSELEALELGGSLPLRFCPKPKPATIQGRGPAGSVHPLRIWL